MRKTWDYEDGLLQVHGEEIVKRPITASTKQLYFKIGWGPPNERREEGGEAQSYIVTCTIRKTNVQQQFLTSLHETHVIMWFFSHRLLTLSTPTLESFRQDTVCGILLRLPSLDGLTVEWGRQMVLYALCRDRYHVGPVHDPTLFPEAIPSTAVLVAVILHHFCCDAKNNGDVVESTRKNVNARDISNHSVDNDQDNSEEQIKQLYNLAAKRMLQEYSEHCQRKNAIISVLLDSFRSGFPLPAIVLKYVHENCVDFDWTSMPFQMLFVSRILHDDITTKYPPPLERKTLFLKTFTHAIEHNNQEVHEELLLTHLQCTELLLRNSHNPSVLPTGYTTLKYGSRGHEFTCTLLMNTGINNNDGLTAWKAGYLMAEFILHRPDIFEGKRCLELGSGTGITAIILARHAKPSALLLTDYDYAILDNLTKNLEINQIGVTGNPDSPTPPIPSTNDNGECSVFVRRLDWSSPDFKLIEEFKPEIIFTCDTVYLPEMLGPLTNIFQFCLQDRTPEPPLPAFSFFGNLVQCFSPAFSAPIVPPPLDQKMSPQTPSSSLPNSPLFGSRPAPSMLTPVYPMVLSMQTKRNEQTFASYLKNTMDRDLVLRNVPINGVPQVFSYPRTPETCELHKITAETII